MWCFGECYSKAGIDALETPSRGSNLIQNPGKQALLKLIYEEYIDCHMLCYIYTLLRIIYYIIFYDTQKNSEWVAL